eukprot:COSAG06_NODE_2456_length_6848_cov_66.970959_3_plen_50_part_00
MQAERRAVDAELWVELYKAEAADAGEKNVLFEPFVSKTAHFTKTGSGQT